MDCTVTLHLTVLGGAESRLARSMLLLLISSLARSLAATLASNTSNANSVETDFVINEELGMATCILCLEELDLGRNTTVMNSKLTDHLQLQCSKDILN